MSLLSELNALIEEKNVPVETGVFSGEAPDSYAVLTPITDVYALFADDVPCEDVEHVRVSIFNKGNYRAVKRMLEKAFIGAGLTITGRTYLGREDDTGYHHYAIDVANNYETEEN